VVRGKNSFKTLSRNGPVVNKSLSPKKREVRQTEDEGGRKKKMRGTQSAVGEHRERTYHEPAQRNCSGGEELKMVAREETGKWRSGKRAAKSLRKQWGNRSKKRRTARGWKKNGFRRGEIKGENGEEKRGEGKSQKKGKLN